jgi:hypothetical protein
MGQQQLLLLILAALIVGMAMIIGLDMVRENSRAANQDEIRDALVTIAARAQGWYRRPLQLGGGGRSFLKIDFDKINFDDSSHSGTFALTNRLSGRFTVTGVSREDSTWSLSLFVYPDSVVRAP